MSRGGLPGLVAVAVAAYVATGPTGRVNAAQDAGGQVAFQYNAKERRDPFVPLVKNGRLLSVRARRSGDGSCPELRGILWDPAGRSLALLGDSEARVGETVEGCEVLDIRRDAVVLSNGAEQVTLQLTFESPPAKEAKGGEEP